VFRISLLFDRDGRSVSHGALSRMSKENLIEIREGNPDVLDYDDLAPYAQEFYVCATSPLARSSMTKVVRLLELEEAARRKSEEEAQKVMVVAIFVIRAASFAVPMPVFNNGFKVRRRLITGSNDGPHSGLWHVLVDFPVT